METAPRNLGDAIQMIGELFYDRRMAIEEVAALRMQNRALLEGNEERQEELEYLRAEVERLESYLEKKSTKGKKGGKKDGKKKLGN